MAVKTPGYRERWLTLLLRNDPRMIWISREEVERAVQVTTLAAAAPEDAVPSEQLAEAERIVAATAHPAGYIIPWPFRMAAFPWINMPLVVGMLAATAANSAAWMVFLNFINQGVNACFNLANGAQGFSAVRKREVFRDFAAAMTIACAVSILGLHVEHSVSFKSPLTRWIVPYLSVVSAGTFNTIISRRGELRDGIMVSNKSGEELGVLSKVAARAAITKALLTRSLLLPAVALLSPTLMGVLFASLPAGGWWASPATRLCIDLVLVALTLSVGLPACAALFPQQMRIPLGRLEPHAQREVLQVSPGKTAVYVYRGI